MTGIHKLSGSTGYTNWAFTMRLFLKSKSLWSIVSGAEPRPADGGSQSFVLASESLASEEDTTGATTATTSSSLPSSSSTSSIADWDRRDSQALMAISIAVSSTQMVHITSKETSKDAWQALEKVHQKQGQSALYTLFTRLITSKYKDGDDLEDHISRMVNIQHDLASISHPLDDKILVIFLLHSLPQSWDTVVMLIEALPSPNNSTSSLPSSETVIAKILAEGERRKISNSSSRRPNAAALSSQPYSNSSSSTDDSKKDLSEVKCYKCKKMGHYANKCRGKKKEEDKVKAKQAGITFSMMANISLGSTSISLRVDGSEEQWLVDSGSGRNFTGRLESLSNFVHSPLTVETANGARIESPGYGDLTLNFENGNSLHLSQVYHLPGATTGLLSVSSLSDKGGSVSFGSDRIAKLTVGSKLVTSTIPGSPYQLPLRSSLSSISSSSTPPSPLSSKLLSSTPSSTLSTPSSSSIISNISSPSPSITAHSTRDTGSGTLMEWHRRLGHIALDRILELDRTKSVEGMILVDKKKEDCEACNLAKSKRSPFKTTSTPVSHPLERLFIDLGFVDHDDHLGRRIYLAIVDQFSCAKWTFTLEDKTSSGVLEVWRSFKENIEKLSGFKIKRVRSDNGSEFISKEFTKELERDGITHERSAPYTPEQNGQVERLNGSLLTLVKTMIKDSNLDKSFWSLALAVATFISNRSPHPRIHDKTPFELITGKKPSIKHLHPFGSPSFVHIDKSLRKKLDDSAVKGFLVGYDGDYNYQIYVPEINRIVVSRHVKFSTIPPSNDTFLPLDSDSSPDSLPIPSDTPSHPIQQLPSPSSSTSSPLIAKDGYEYRLVPVGSNPGQFEEIDKSNIIEGGRRTRRPIVYGSSAQDEVIYVKFTQVLDDEGSEVDGSWEEESVFVGVSMADTPRTYDEAMASKDKVKWKDAIETEWNAFDEHGVLEVSKLPPGARALGTTWVFVKKTDEHGNVVRHKARLVAQGFGQRPGIDVNETFAPVARTSTIRFLIALAASQDLIIEQFDYDTAFLNGGMSEDVYIKIPPGYPHSTSSGDVLKLVKAMYGTKQAPREWNMAVDKLMKDRGYTKSSSDSCLYTKMVNGSQVIVVLYVDDGLILAKNQQIVDEELEAFNKVYKLKHLGRVSTFLSLQFSHTSFGIFIHQSKYVSSIVSRYLDTPIPSRSSASTPMDSTTSTNPSSPSFSDLTLYQSAVGALQYAAQLSRPDIAAAVRKVAQQLSSPSEEDWISVKRIFRYLSKTLDFGIAFIRGGSMDMVVYSDASWADDQENRRSVGAFAIIVAGGVVSWRSKQQALIATSTTESETIAVSDATKEVLSFRKLYDDLSIPLPSSTTILEDNTACIAISQNPSSHGRTKHFDVVTLFIRERIAFGDIKLRYCPTTEMTADVLTKGLSKGPFETHRSGLGMVSLNHWIGGSVKN